jgi:hypothetical protein
MENIGKIIGKILAGEDVTCMAHLIMTLELNRIESDYQHPENPAIFQREYDEICLTKKLIAISPFYKEFEDEIISRMENIHRPDFLDERASDAIAALKTAPKKLEKTVEAFRLESLILDRIKQKYPNDYEKFPPVLQKSYDEAGFIKSYSINSEQLDKIK